MKIWFRQALQALRKDKRGVTIIEYALLAALIAVALIGGVTTLKNSISSTFSTIATSI